MTDEPPSAAVDGIRHKLLGARPTIKILLYTDDPLGITNDDGFFGLQSMIVRLQAHQPRFAIFAIQFLSRSSNIARHADNRLDVALERERTRSGSPFDEIWFFGTHQVTTTGRTAGPFGGGPQSELDAAERAALESWMDAANAGGGVMIAGDHSENRPRDAVTIPTSACPDDSGVHEPLAQGRAIGRCVPRAGLMRVWHGDPNREPRNTDTVGFGGGQEDATPQTIVPLSFDENGTLSPGGKPHPVFFYRPNEFINVLPDHQHEGALVNKFDPNDWPSQGSIQPLPQVIAMGLNQRNASLFDLLSAYDGDSVNVGRIIADSSWHHYLNVNLTNFHHPAAIGTASDKIGQFYSNLGIWLAPKKKRLEMAHALLWELANFVIAMRGSDDNAWQLGKFAYRTVLRVAAPCEIHELIKVLFSNSVNMSFVEISSLFTSQVQPVEMLIGSILKACCEEITKSRENVETYVPTPLDELIDLGVAQTEQWLSHNNQLRTIS